MADEIKRRPVRRGVMTLLIANPDYSILYILFY